MENKLIISNEVIINEPDVLAKQLKDLEYFAVRGINKFHSLCNIFTNLRALSIQLMPEDETIFFNQKFAKLRTLSLSYSCININRSSNHGEIKHFRLERNYRTPFLHSDLVHLKIT